jgi:hypothetical protein
MVIYHTCSLWIHWWFNWSSVLDFAASNPILHGSGNDICKRPKLSYMANLPFDLVSCPWTIRLHGFVVLQLYTITTSVLTAQTIYYGHIYHRLKRNRRCIKVRISIYMYSLLIMKQQFSTIKDVFYWVNDQISWTESKGNQLSWRWVWEAENCVNYCETKPGLEWKTEFFEFVLHFIL